MRQREEIEWVPASEGLPDDPGPYLYTNARGTVGLGTLALIAGQIKIGGIVAWAPMPRGYRPEEG